MICISLTATLLFRRRDIMHIAKGIDMLEITAQVMGGSDTLYPVLLHNDKTAVLMDTGYPGLLENFKKAFEVASVPWSKLGTIVLTHQDLDHIGSLPVIVTSREGEVPCWPMPWRSLISRVKKCCSSTRQKP